ncbi:hypothetical protein [Phreatobacter sp. AB_2022a]|uniref:hypothetical protein n=1 Tax=Phreatobacter sp. AB_2022a TaxID=3003134 RepID=UPI0022873DFF|nr:hypothetical protein [Phreatobacter sp. AB_2022a]MCZ0738172.1 hypothetical protein [Phreatobacter sp. AB_2022a]
MSFDAIQFGSVIRFSYLWTREAVSGETEGRKDRPTAFGMRVPKPNGEDLVVLFPITSQPPQPGRFAVEVPDMEKRRGGLDSALQLWIVLDDYNTDIIGRSFHLEPLPPLGQFSKAFFLTLMREFVRLRSEARGVERWR